MKSKEMIARMIEKADIYAHEAKYNDNFMSREYYEAVSDVLSWVLNSGTDTFFEYEDELFA